MPCQFAGFRYVLFFNSVVYHVGVPVSIAARNHTSSQWYLSLTISYLYVKGGHIVRTLRLSIARKGEAIFLCSNVDMYLGMSAEDTCMVS